MADDEVGAPVLVLLPGELIADEDDDAVADAAGLAEGEDESAEHPVTVRAALAITTVLRDAAT